MKSRDLWYFFLLSRPLNIGISFLSLCIACFIASQKNIGFFEDLSFWLAAIALIFVAATGYWINDVYDFRIDRINKPKQTIVNAYLSVKKVLTAYFVVTPLVVGSTTFFLNVEVVFINWLSVLLLFVYASYLKRISVAGNLVIALLTSLVILLGGFLYTVNMPLLWTAIFAFQVTLLREIVKDVEDIEGDLAYQLHTLPIQVGIQQTKRVLWVLYALFLVSCYLPLVFRYMVYGEFLWKYMLVSIALVQLPTVYLAFLLKQAEKATDFHRQSQYLKLLIFAGIVSVLFLK